MGDLRLTRSAALGILPHLPWPARKPLMFGRAAAGACTNQGRGAARFGSARGVVRV